MTDDQRVEALKKHLMTPQIVGLVMRIERVSPGVMRLLATLIEESYRRGLRDGREGAS